MEASPQGEYVRLEEKLDAIYRSVEQTRKYFLYTLIVSAVMVVLPVVGLLFAIPAFLDTLGSAQDLSILEDLGGL
jgi:hypothetical protein